MPRVEIEIYPPIPPQIAPSYTGFDYYKFGCCAWTYNGFRGEIEWINSLKWCTNSKYPDVDGFDYWFAPGVLFNIHSKPTPITIPPDFLINLIPFNPATGKNMPMRLPL